jgi:uncharacterized membrane protein (DUF4010 family)
VLLGAAAARDYQGAGGLYGVAVLSELHDLDAITLSTARPVEQGHVQAELGWRLILTASLPNLVLKGAAAAFGGLPLLRRLAIPYGAALLGGPPCGSSGPQFLSGQWISAVLVPSG